MGISEDLSPGNGGTEQFRTLIGKELLSIRGNAIFEEPDF
jgi:hypothetical protein